MKKFFRFLLILIVILVVVVGVLTFVLPTDYDIKRSVKIKAPKHIVMQQLATFQAFNTWSPWIGMDPQMKNTYEGEPGKVGSRYIWDSQIDSVGSGSMEITLVTDKRIEQKLKFVKPFEDEALTYFDITDSSGYTSVSWGMKGTNKRPMNVLTWIMGMTAMIEAKYDQGLAKLKIICEAKKVYRGYEIKEVDFPEQYILSKKGTVSFGQIGEFLQTNYPLLIGAMDKSSIKSTGAPMAIYYTWDEKYKRTDMAAALPVGDAKTRIYGFETLTLPASKGVQLAYYGSYDKAAQAHGGIMDYMQEKGYKQSMVIEQYITDPMLEKDTSKWLTHIIYRYK